MQYKTRKYEIAQADAGDGLTLSPSNLGFNPSNEFRKVQISTNDFGGGAGTFALQIRPVGSENFYDFVTQAGANADAGEDIIIAGRDVDPLFDALKLTFGGATSDIVVNIAFIDESK
jgi:hypothetical protein